MNNRTTQQTITANSSEPRALTGKVTQVQIKRGLFGQEVKSFSMMTEKREVLVTLRHRISTSFSVGSDIWVTGDLEGAGRVQADIVFLPHLQQEIDVRVKDGFPLRSMIGLGLFLMMFFFQNPHEVFFYIGLPVGVVYLLWFKRPVRPTLCAYRNWELIEEQIESPDKNLINFKFQGITYKLEKLVLGCGGVVLLWFDVYSSIFPLAMMFSFSSLPFEFLLYTLTLNILLFAGILSLTLKLFSDVVLGVAQSGK